MGSSRPVTTCSVLGRPPCRRVQRVHGDGGPLQRPHEAHPPLDAAVVEHNAGRRHLHGRPVRLAVEEQPAAALGALRQGVGERQRLVAVAPGNGEYLRLGPVPGWV